MIQPLIIGLAEIPVALQASLITGIITLLGVVIGQTAIEYRRNTQKQEEIDAIKAALKSELKQMQYIDELPDDWKSSEKVTSDGQIPIEMIPPAEHISTTIYNENASELGKLQADEVEKLVEFYGNIEYVKSLITDIRKNEPESENPYEGLWALLISYRGMRKDLIQMLDGDLEPENVNSSQVIKKFGGELTEAENVEPLSADEISNIINNQR